MNVEHELSLLLPVIDNACQDHNAFTSTARQAKKRLLSNPAEAVATYLASKNIRGNSLIVEAIAALGELAEHRESKKRMEQEWEAYYRGVRTHKRVWETFFRSEIKGEELLYVTGEGSHAAFRAHVRFNNLETNALYTMGSSNVKQPPRFLSSVGAVLMHGSAVSSAILDTPVEQLVDADPTLHERMRSAMEQMKTAYADVLFQHRKDSDLVASVQRELGFDAMIASMKSGAFTKLSMPRDAKSLLSDHKSSVAAGVSVWLKLFANPPSDGGDKLRVVLQHVSDHTATEVQVRSDISEEGYATRLLDAQNAYHRARYHQDMCALYSSVCRDVAHKCKNAASLLADKRFDAFRKRLDRVQKDAREDYEQFQPDKVRPQVKASDEALLQSHRFRMIQLDLIHTIKQLMKVFQDDLRSRPGADMVQRMKAFGKPAHVPVETKWGAEWIRQDEAVFTNLGLDNEVAVRDDKGAPLTYADILRIYSEDLQTFVGQELARFSALHRPLPTLVPIPPQPYLVDSRAFFDILRPLAAELSKAAVPADLNPADAVHRRMAIEQVLREASKPSSEKRSMSDLCLYVLMLRQASLVVVV